MGTGQPRGTAEGNLSARRCKNPWTANLGESLKKKEKRARGLEGKGEQQFPVLSRLEDRMRAKSEMHDEKSKHPDKNTNYEPTQNIFKK